MRKHTYSHTLQGEGWPLFDEIEPYFRKPPDGRGWFHDSGNDSARLDAIGVDGGDDLPFGRGRVDVNLWMWGHPDLGVLLIYQKAGGGHHEAFTSKGDLSKLKQWVRTLHGDPMPIGLYIPFERAWLAVKEFIETDGQLPNSIEWVRTSDLPDQTFPDPSVRLPGESEE
jgi:hypothetical protein